MDKELPENSNEVIKQKPSRLKNMFLTVRQYFFQFFMLFLAVVSGFFAENLREEFGERKQAKEYANTLVNDLIRDTKNIQYHINRLKETVKDINELAEYVRERKIDQLNNTELYRLTLIFPNTPYRWSRATLEQIKSSGSLRFFSNDSIVYYISQYDAWTIHLDQDNFQDQERFNSAFEKKVLVVDSNYPNEFRVKIKSNPDSLMKTSYYADITSSKQLLTNDLNEVKSMVAAYLIVKDYYLGRIKELSELIRDQDRLILLVKREYN